MRIGQRIGAATAITALTVLGLAGCSSDADSEPAADTTVELEIDTDAVAPPTGPAVQPVPTSPADTPDPDTADPAEPTDGSDPATGPDEESYLQAREGIGSPTRDEALAEGYGVCAQLKAGEDYLSVRSVVGTAGSEVEIGGVVHSAAAHLCPDQYDRLLEISSQRER